jgi:hypothetical protein
LVDVQESVEVWPAVMLAGLKEAVQLGGLGAPTVTSEVQVAVTPALLATVNVQVWDAVGEKD